ncbi:hypothetical protein [Streptomyces sp. NPDC096132]|uniref:hypothetical protein n=1 Tax=Streptomyces sp. NPDC096132 TaxID=3366075 RepID=UPI003806D704
MRGSPYGETALAGVGTRGADRATSTEELAKADSAVWVYGARTQPDRAKVTTSPVTSWSFFGAKGVDEEVPDTTIRKITGTVRVYEPPVPESVQPRRGPVTPPCPGRH